MFHYKKLLIKVFDSAGSSSEIEERGKKGGKSIKKRTSLQGVTKEAKQTLRNSSKK